MNGRHWSEAQKTAFARAYEKLAEKEQEIRDLVEVFNSKNHLGIIAGFTVARYEWGTLYGVIPMRSGMEAEVKRIGVPRWYNISDLDLREFSQEQLQALAQLAADIAEKFGIKAQAGDLTDLRVPTYKLKPFF